MMKRFSSSWNPRSTLIEWIKVDGRRPRSVRARSARISIFLFILCHSNYHKHQSIYHNFISQEYQTPRSNAHSNITKYLTRASRSNTGTTRGKPINGIQFGRLNKMKDTYDHGAPVIFCFSCCWIHFFLKIDNSANLPSRCIWNQLASDGAIFTQHVF